MIIGLCGPAGSGKDTAADFLVKNHGFVKVAFADPLKRICKDVFAFTDGQLWGPSEKRNAPDKRYPRNDRYIYPTAPAGSLWFPVGGGHTLINDDDVEEVSFHKWCVNNKEEGKKTAYIRRTLDSLKLHQLLLGEAPPGHVIDHINGDGLDNRRANLRFCTQAENHANESKRVGGTSVFKGVGFDAARQKWSAKITVAGETKNLGRFDQEVDAALAYDKAATGEFGEYARTNAKLFLTPRYALQQLGTNWGRDCYPDVWVDYALRTASRLLADDQDSTAGVNYYSQQSGLLFVGGLPKPEGVVISDVRFKNEVRAINAASGAVIRIKRPTTLSGAAAAHLSETESSTIPANYFSFEIDNSGTLEELERLTATALAWVRNK
jgi:hypothetical protein